MSFISGFTVKCMLYEDGVFILESPDSKAEACWNYLLKIAI